MELPPDWNKPAGFVIARMMYPSAFRRLWRASARRRLAPGRHHLGGGLPARRSHYASLLRRLTTIDVRSVEQPVNLEDGDDVFDWPYLIVGLPGFWELTDEHTAKLREYLLRGGFLFCDSFFGSDQWEGFAEGMRRVFPDREIIDLPDDHPLFHTVYDLDAKGQVPNMNSLLGGGGGYLERWRRAALARHRR